MGMSNQLLIKRFSLSEVEAGDCMTFYVIYAMIGIPIFGLLFNKFGGKTIGLVVGATSMLVGFVMLVLSPSGIDKALLHIPLVCIAGFYSIYCSTFNPVLFLTLPSRSAGMGIGISTMLENVGLSIMPVFSGFVVDNFGFQYYLLILILLAILNLSVVTALLVRDLKGDRRLIKIEKQLEIHNNYQNLERK